MTKSDGTKLAASCSDYSVYIWDYPIGETLTRGKYESGSSDSFPMIVWNTFNPDILATYLPQVRYNNTTAFMSRTI